MNITPAALRALVEGDMENFYVASTPGGIEAQEKAGQMSLATASKLPKEMYGDAQKALEARGVKFLGPDEDALFVKVEFPSGWKIEPTSHHMHSNLMDENGKKVAEIFYKAAFYDRRADLSLAR